MTSMLITGTPGTGKSLLAQQLTALLDWPAFTIKDEAVRQGLTAGYDEARDAIIIPEEAVEEILRALEHAHENLILEGHLSHYARPKAGRRLIVLETPLPLLKERLAQRGYPEAKIRENLDAEIFKVCRMEALELGWQPLILTTDMPVEELVSEVLDWLHEENRKTGRFWKRGFRKGKQASEE